MKRKRRRRRARARYVGWGWVLRSGQWVGGRTCVLAELGSGFVYFVGGGFAGLVRLGDNRLAAGVVGWCADGQTCCFDFALARSWSRC